MAIPFILRTVQGYELSYAQADENLRLISEAYGEMQVMVLQAESAMDAAAVSAAAALGSEQAAAQSASSANISASNAASDADSAYTDAQRAEAAADRAEGAVTGVVSVQGKQGIVSLVRSDFTWMGDAAERAVATTAFLAGALLPVGLSKEDALRTAGVYISGSSQITVDLDQPQSGWNGLVAASKLLSATHPLPFSSPFYYIETQNQYSNDGAVIQKIWSYGGDDYCERSIRSGQPVAGWYNRADSGVDTDYIVVNSNITAVVGGRYGINTSTASRTLTLPSTAIKGDSIFVFDLIGTWSEKNAILNRSGKNIMGLAENMNLDKSYAAFELLCTGNDWRLV